MNESAANETQRPVFHLFRKNGQALLFDPGLCLAFELDSAGEVTWRVMLGEDADSVSHSTASGAEEAARAREEISALQKQAYLRGPRASFGSPPPGSRVFSVDLTHHCNLRCRYCFVDRNDAGGSPRRMSEEVMTQTARFLAHEYRERMLWVRISNGWRSEAALDLSPHARFVRICESEGRRLGIDLVPMIPASNYAVGGNSALVAMQREYCPIVSLDGPPEAHDALRVYPDGRGTYADVIAGVSWARAQGWKPSVNAVVTSLYPDVSAVYFHLFELGFGKIVVKPVRAKPDEVHAIGRDLRGICAGYDRFAERLLASPDEELLRHILCIGNDDYFKRFLVRIAERHRLERRCDAGIQRGAIDVDGRVYPCPSLAGVPQTCIGSVWDGVDDSRVQEWEERLHVSRRAPCSSCWARLLCGGGCMHQSYLTHGSFGPPDPSECALNKHLVELAIWTYSQLQTRPQVLAALPRVAKGNWSNAPLLPCHHLKLDEGDSQAAYGLLERRPTGVIRRSAHLKRRLPSSLDDHEVAIRLAWNSNDLLVLFSPCGPDPRALQESVTAIDLHFLLPSGMKGWAQAMLPPSLSHLEWVLAASLSASCVNYVDTPQRYLSEQSVPGSQIVTGRHGCFIRLPWIGLQLPPPSPGSEFGLGLTLSDAQGGQLEWFPHHEAGRVRLLPPQVN